MRHDTCYFTCNRCKKIIKNGFLSSFFVSEHKDVMGNTFMMVLSSQGLVAEHQYCNECFKIILNEACKNAEKLEDNTTENIGEAIK